MSSTNEEIPPQHHLHSANEPLPRSKDGATTTDYSPGTMNQTRLSEEGSAQDSGSTPHQDENTVKRMSDKIIGKTQEIVGKVTRNPQLQEKGAERAHPKTIT